MNDSGFQAIARERGQGMIMRLGLAALAAVIATLLYPTWWPVAWLCLYAVAQAGDNGREQGSEDDDQDRMQVISPSDGRRCRPQSCRASGSR